MTANEEIAGLDLLISRTHDKVLQVKLQQTAEFVRELEQRVARLELVRTRLARPGSPLDPTEVRKQIPAFLDAVQLSLGAFPSIVDADVGLLKTETWAKIGPEFEKQRDMMERLRKVPEHRFLEKSREQQAAFERERLAVYVRLAEQLLALYSDLRDRYIGELNARVAGKPLTLHDLRVRDTKQRDDLIRKLRKENPTRSWVYLFNAAIKSAAMQQVLARGHTTLKSKETIRNVISPRAANDKGKKYEASDAETREHRFKSRHQ